MKNSDILPGHVSGLDYYEAQAFLVFRRIPSPILLDMATRPLDFDPDNFSLVDAIYKSALTSNLLFNYGIDLTGIWDEIYDKDFMKYSDEYLAEMCNSAFGDGWWCLVNLNDDENVVHLPHDITIEQLETGFILAVMEACELYTPLYGHHKGY